MSANQRPGQPFVDGLVKDTKLVENVEYLLEVASRHVLTKFVEWFRRIRKCKKLTTYERQTTRDHNSLAIGLVAL